MAYFILTVSNGCTSEFKNFYCPATKGDRHLLVQSPMGQENPFSREWMKISQDL
jgi:hypothetical protein